MNDQLCEICGRLGIIKPHIAHSVTLETCGDCTRDLALRPAALAFSLKKIVAKTPDFDIATLLITEMLLGAIVGAGVPYWISMVIALPRWFLYLLPATAVAGAGVSTYLFSSKDVHPRKLASGPAVVPKVWLNHQQKPVLTMTSRPLREILEHPVAGPAFTQFMMQSIDRNSDMTSAAMACQVAGISYMIPEPCLSRAAGP